MKSFKTLNLATVLLLLILSNPAYGQDTENVPFAKIDQAPYPDECKAVKDDPEVVKTCLANYIAKFVGDNFKSKKFLTYPPKRYRISVQFTIDDEGRTTKILVRAPNKDMENEAIRVIKALPRINPGMVDDKPVNVIYGLPINFVVPEKTKKKKN